METNLFRHPWPIRVLTLLVIGLLGWIDFGTGFELSFFVFYFIPVIFAASRLGQEGAIGASVISAMVWGIADYYSGHTYSIYFFAVWNALIRLVAFLLVGLAFARIRDVLRAEREANERLRKATSEIKVLEGLLPICSTCKKIRSENGEWTRMEKYIGDRSTAKFSHGYCPDCLNVALREAGISEDKAGG